MKKLIATVTAGLALSGMAGVGLSAGLSSPAGAATPAAVSPSAPTGRHPLRAWLRAHRKAVARDTVKISAKTIGVTPKDLVSTLRSGKSIAQVAQANNVDPQTVVDALVQAADAKIGAAVTNHRLTQAQATKIEAALPGAVTKLVNHVYGQHAG
jgi:hypothetical protein